MLREQPRKRSLSFSTSLFLHQLVNDVMGSLGEFAFQPTWLGKPILVLLSCGKNNFGGNCKSGCYLMRTQ